MGRDDAGERRRAPDIDFETAPPVRRVCPGDGREGRLVAHAVDHHVDGRGRSEGVRGAREGRSEGGGVLGVRCECRDVRRGIFRLERGDEWREQDYAATDEGETLASSFEEGARCCLADAA